MVQWFNLHIHARVGAAFAASETWPTAFICSRDCYYGTYIQAKIIS
jgi:hypothetical protein